MSSVYRIIVEETFLEEGKDRDPITEIVYQQVKDEIDLPAIINAVNIKIEHEDGEKGSE